MSNYSTSLDKLGAGGMYSYLYSFAGKRVELKTRLDTYSGILYMGKEQDIVFIASDKELVEVDVSAVLRVIKA